MSFANPAYLLLGVPVLGLWLFALRARARLRWLALPLLCVLALADPRLTRPAAGGNVVLLVDRSASVRGEGLARARALAPELERVARARGAALYTLGFGRGAGVLAAPGEELAASGLAAAQDDSDLTAGLQLAAAQPDAGDIVLISDGLYTTDDPLPLAVELGRRGVRVHTSLVGAPGETDAAITRVLTPARVPQGQPFTLGVEVRAQKAQPARLRLRDARGQLLLDQPVDLPAGTRRYALRLDASAAGVQRLEVELSTAEDAQPGNNRAQTLLEVVGPPRALVYTRNPQSLLVRALASSGLALELHSQGEPLMATAISGAVAVVLENMPLGALGDGADAALEHYVRQLGGGLLITGGEQSYALGGYYKSALEPLLPVRLDRQDELRRPRVDLAIALDRSGSMAVPVDGTSQKMDLANRGASAAIELLAPGDGVCVLAVDTAAHVVVELQRIRDGAHTHELLRKVRAIEAEGGGIYVHTALAAAMDALLSAQAQTRHVVLFADAADAEEPGDARALVRAFLQAGGSLSVIGLGSEQDQDAALLRDLAAIGGGRVYFTQDAHQLPRVFAQDAMYVARKTFVRAPTPVLPARGLLALQLASTEVPAIGGYNLCYLAPGAEAALMSGDKEQAPLAASWQRGAGKVMAVTFEADGAYTGELARWSEYQAFFRSSLEWLKRPAGEPDVDAELTLEGRSAQLRVELPEGHGLTHPPDAYLYSDAGGEPTPLQLYFSGPNTLEARAPVESSHAYQALLALPGQPPLAVPWRVQPYSPELAVVSGERPPGDQVLAQLAAASGGGVFTRAQVLEQPHVRAGQPPRSLAALLAAAALLLLVADVALRRGLAALWLAPLGRRVEPLRAAARRRWLRLAGAPRRTPPPVAAQQPSAAEEPPAQAPPEAALARAKRRARQRRGES